MVGFNWFKSGMLSQSSIILWAQSLLAIAHACVHPQTHQTKRKRKNKVILDLPPTTQVRNYLKLIKQLTL